MDDKTQILVVMDHYVPGYKAGGPIRTLTNLVDWLGEEFRFYVLTADRDLGDRQPYPNTQRGIWQPVGKARVLYLSSWQMTLWSLRTILRTIHYDLLYLNSFFAASTRSILLLRRLGLVSDKPVILAPRGEFSKGALAIKGLRKRPYIWLAKRLGLYDNVTWQASSEYEQQDIMVAFGAHGATRSISLTAAPNLPPRLPFSGRSQRRAIKRAQGARVLFLSRIARKKNLDFALDLLSAVEGDVEFDIYGPIEDMKHWQECQALMRLLPDNVRPTYKGAVHPEQVRDVFGQYHLFLFPTRGENFGHVIFEALSAGCVVLTSDQTPWRNLAEKKAGCDIPLTEPSRFREALARFLAMDNATFLQWSAAARDYAHQFASDSALIEANRQLFLGALACRS